MSEILFEDFQKIDLRVGTVLEVKDFPTCLLYTSDAADDSRV